MDGSLSFTPTQLALVGILLGFLLIWMITFAILALRSGDKMRLEDLPTPTGPHPALPLQNSLQVFASPPLEIPVGAAQSDQYGA
jgi:hypothetical protein